MDVSGNPAATILPSADTGIISASGTFFPEAVIPVRWTVDNAFAYLHAQGVGSVDMPVWFLFYSQILSEAE